MKKVIISTTINPPTEAIKRFDAMPGWELVVIGDKKTPTDYKLRRGRYVTPEEQEALFPELSRLIGWNCIQRRNIGFLIAHSMNADIVATVDDDNIPMPGWGENLMVGKVVSAIEWDSSLPAIDPIFCSGVHHLWHRGFPLPLVSQRMAKTSACGMGEIIADVQADYWNGDPDIDAFCRMEHAPDIHFSEEPFPFYCRKPSPFNSQNTFISSRVLKHYFMWTKVGRYDDIIGGYVAQAHGAKVVYGKASVFQKRNDHDLMRDFENEVWGMMNISGIIEDLKSPQNMFNRLPESSTMAFRLYQSYF